MIMKSHTRGKRLWSLAGEKYSWEPTRDGAATTMKDHGIVGDAMP